MILPQPVPTKNEAPADERVLAASLQSAMSTLQSVLEEETGLLRIGDFKRSTELEAKKSEASRTYVAAATRAQNNQPYMARLVPDVLRSLHDQHARLRDVLQINLTVLATAHAVSEAVVRGVNSEVQKRTMPQTYTSYGQRSAPAPRSAVPIAVSRSL